MTSMRPDWQTDDGAAVPIHIQGQAPGEAVDVATVSRRPAAIIGIMIVLAFGAALLQATGTLRGQISDAVVVSITAQGFSPASITVARGDSIRWRNDDNIPHILASATLETDDHSPMESPPIFPGEDYTTTVTTDATEGIHTYISRTSTLNGEITVREFAPPPPPESSSSASAQTSMSAPLVPTETTPPPGAMGTLGIPTNPNTVNKAGVSFTAPKPVGGPAKTSVPPPAITQTKTKPRTQPSSGLGGEALIILAAAGVWRIWKKQLKKS